MSAPDLTLSRLHRQLAFLELDRRGAAERLSQIEESIQLFEERIRLAEKPEKARS
jgi:hypothetical protein